MTEPVYKIETATVYRACGRRYFSRDAAIKHYARQRFFTKHPCECEREEYASGYPGYGYYCGHHEHWQKVMPRYLRIIRKQLRAIKDVA
jgi:hypothetical protein